MCEREIMVIIYFLFFKYGCQVLKYFHGFQSIELKFDISKVQRDVHFSPCSVPSKQIKFQTKKWSFEKDHSQLFLEHLANKTNMISVVKPEVGLEGISISKSYYSFC